MVFEMISVSCPVSSGELPRYGPRRLRTLPAQKWQSLALSGADSDCHFVRSPFRFDQRPLYFIWHGHNLDCGTGTRDGCSAILVAMRVSAHVHQPQLCARQLFHRYGVCPVHELHGAMKARLYAKWNFTGECYNMAGASRMLPPRTMNGCRQSPSHLPFTPT